MAGCLHPSASCTERNMANLGKKGELYVARFRYGGKEYKKSLKTDRVADARAELPPPLSVWLPAQQEAGKAGFPAGLS